MSMAVMHASELGRKYLELLSADRLDECIELFRDDVMLVLPATMQKGVLIGKQEFRKMLSHAMSLFENRPRYIVTGQTSEGNRSSIEFRGQGTLKNGKEYDNTYCIVFVAEGGKITEFREYCDTHYAFTVF